MVAAPNRTPHRLSPVEPITVPRYLGGWWIPDVAIAVLRVAIALLFALHGVQELFGLLLPPGQKWLGAPAPLTDRWIAGSLQLFGATLLATGTYTRLAAFGLAVLGVLGYFAPLRARGHWTFNGVELIALVSVVLVTFSIIGPGLFSLDAFREGRRRPRTTGSTVSLSPWIRRQYRHRELTR